MKTITQFVVLFMFASKALAGTCQPEAAGSFEPFLASIQASTATLIENSSSPMKWRVMGNADEQRPRTLELHTNEFNAKAQLIWPATNPTLKIRSSSATAKEAQVVVAKPDTDYQFIFNFHRIGNCWRLTAVEDQSL